MHFNLLPAKRGDSPNINDLRLWRGRSSAPYVCACVRVCEPKPCVWEKDSVSLSHAGVITQSFINEENNHIKTLKVNRMGHSHWFLGNSGRANVLPAATSHILECAQGLTRCVMTTWATLMFPSFKSITYTEKTKTKRGRADHVPMAIGAPPGLLGKQVASAHGAEREYSSSVSFLERGPRRRERMRLNTVTPGIRAALLL